MKKHLAIFSLVLLMLGLCAVPVFAQGASGTVKGVCKDAQGNPIVDGVVVWANQDNGQKYTLKTNKKGEYFSLGVSAGNNYTVSLYKNADDAKAGKEMFHFGKVQVTIDENTLDFDLKKRLAGASVGSGPKFTGTWELTENTYNGQQKAVTNSPPLTITQNESLVRIGASEMSITSAGL